MRPVHESAAIVPHVFARKAQRATRLQTGNVRREVEVVGDQQRVSVLGAHEKALMSSAAQILPQHARDDAGACDRDVPRVRRDRPLKSV